MKNKLAVYPGSFDPATNGHVDIIKRATLIFDELIIGVAVDTHKKPTLFSVEERVDMLKQICQPFENVSVEAFDKLLVNWAKRKEACAIVRGLRALSDFDYEFQMALANRKLQSYVETVFLMTREDCACISASTVKEIAALGGSVENLVPEVVNKALKKKLGLEV